MRSKLLITALALLLAGCAGVAPEKDPLEGASPVYSWQAQGEMIFRCTYDEKGFYWAFVRPEGKLLNDSGREQAALGADFSVTARDGSSVRARIVEQGPQTSARDLRTAVFAAESQGRGMLEGVRAYTRRQPEGGMPLAPCAASLRGHLLRVPFRARYVFYR